MSANPTRIDWEASPSAAEPGFPLQEGNRVLESLARQEALRALLAFSDLHERIRNRRAEGTTSASDLDLFQTGRFVLDEVLQLICDRALSITHADAVLVALAEGSQRLRRGYSRRSRFLSPDRSSLHRSGSAARSANESGCAPGFLRHAIFFQR